MDRTGFTPEPGVPAPGSFAADVARLKAENTNLRAEVVTWQERCENNLGVADAGRERLRLAELQIEELKKDMEKITEGAIRFVQSSLCEEHQGRVKMQSPVKFIAEHDGKCVLCAFRLISVLRSELELTEGWLSEQKSVAATEIARRIRGTIHSQFIEKRNPVVACPSCGMAFQPTEGKALCRECERA